MNLPQISLPHIPIAINIPHLMHPCIIHIVIALPILILLLEIINLFTKRKTIGIISFFFMLLFLFVSLVAYLSGSVDAKLAHNTLSSPVWNLVQEHKLLAVYIIYLTSLLVIFKLLSVLFKSTPMKILMFLFLIIVIITIANNAKRGKSLVYEYSVNVKCVKAQNTNEIKNTSNLTISPVEHNITNQREEIKETNSTLKEKNDDNTSLKNRDINTSSSNDNV